MKVAFVKFFEQAPYRQKIPDWVSEAFVREGVEFVAYDCTTREELEQYAGNADVVWVFESRGHTVTAENLDVLRRCGAIISSSSGTDHLPVAEATNLGIIVANTPGAPSEEVSEHSIGLLFAVKRCIVVHDRALRAGRWDETFVWPGRSLRGQTLGLVGFGHIARLVARKLSGFEMTTLAYDPYASADVMASQGVRAASLKEVLSTSDFVSVHCPLTEKTYHLIAEGELRTMKREAILINTARGEVVDEDALVRALTEGWIAGAGLDVFEQEPVAEDNPLFKLDNVVVTPHMAGFADLYFEPFWRLTVETALDLTKGHWPLSYVNHGVRPRWNLTSNPRQQDK